MPHIPTISNIVVLRCLAGVVGGELAVRCWRCWADFFCGEVLLIWLVFTGVLSEAGKKIDFLQTFFLTSVGCMCYVAIQAGGVPR